jgi:DNA-binding CsgD family transcriptional regulator
MSAYVDMVKAVTVRHHDKIKKICEPLFTCLNLCHFWYYKLTNKGYLSFLGYNAEWGECFAGEQLYLKYPFCRHPDFFREGLYLHKEVQEGGLKEVYDTCKLKFNMQQSLQFIQKTEEGMVEFGFSSNCRSDVQTAIFLSEAPLLKLFGSKFLDGTGLRYVLEDNYVDLAGLLGTSFYEKSEMVLPKMEGKRALLEGLGLKCGLSRGEREMLSLLVKGLPASQIAQGLYRSKRTVEHMVERTKEKLACYSKAELVQKARELEQVGYLDVVI